MDIQEVRNAIMKGDFDDALDSIMDSVSMRERYLSDSKILNLSIGDIVKFNSKTNPKYLRGVRAQVVGVKRTRVTVKPSEGQYTGRYTGVITTPVSLIDKVV